MKNKIYQVWIENEKESQKQDRIVDEKVLFEGNKTNANKYYKSHGGASAGLHIGYILW